MFSPIASAFHLAVFLAGQPGLSHELIKPPEVEKPAPDFKVTPIGGDRTTMLTLQDFRGKTLIIEFWATWCGPCHQARKELRLLHREFADRGLRILAVSTEARDVVEKFVESHPVPYQVAVDSSRMISLKYPCSGLPTSYVIDSNGLVRAYGFTPRRSMIAHLISTGESPPHGPPSTQPTSQPDQPSSAIQSRPTGAE